MELSRAGGRGELWIVIVCRGWIRVIQKCGRGQETDVRNDAVVQSVKRFGAHTASRSHINSHSHSV